MPPWPRTAAIRPNRTLAVRSTTVSRILIVRVASLSVSRPLDVCNRIRVSSPSSRAPPTRPPRKTVSRCPPCSRRSHARCRPTSGSRPVSALVAAGLSVTLKTSPLVLLLPAQRPPEIPTGPPPLSSTARATAAGRRPCRSRPSRCSCSSPARVAGRHRPAPGRLDVGLAPVVAAVRLPKPLHLLIDLTSRPNPRRPATSPSRNPGLGAAPRMRSTKPVGTNSRPPGRIPQRPTSSCPARFRFRQVKPCPHNSARIFDSSLRPVAAPT